MTPTLLGTLQETQNPMELQAKVYLETHCYCGRKNSHSCLSYSSPNAIHTLVVGFVSLCFGLSYVPRIFDIDILNPESQGDSEGAPIY